ncbi:MAG: FecR domain-containing protein [Bacteroidetes bacterium]|nr:FecR domain-containing protein [Bacteroidota bacterium]
MEEDKKIDERLVAYLTGESESDPGSVSPGNELFRELEKTWELAGTAYSYRKSNPDKAWEKLNEKIGIEPKVVRLKRFNYLRYAAIFVVLFALGSIMFLLTRNPDTISEQLVSTVPEMKAIQTVANPSALTTVVLPDGSMVKMNASSILQYPKQFSTADRRVKLSGEAYFEVIHDASRPFVVELDHAIVEDLGTSFNISAYPGRGQVEVNVTSGSVRIQNKNQKEEAILPAGSNGKILRENGEILVSNKLSPNYLSWITKEISFHHTPLSTVFAELENIYHVRIEFSDPKIANIPYTANFEKFQLEDIVNVIAKTHHLSVTKRANGFVFATY